MKLLTSYTYGDHLDGDLIPVVIMTHGETTDDLIPALTDDIAQTLAINDGVTIEDNEGKTIGSDVQSVCEAIANGATTIMVHRTEDTDVYTINDFNP